MKTKILGEPRFTKEALFGIGLSYGMTSDAEVNELDTNTAERLKTVARRLAHQQGGHNKFLESITLVLDIDAPRYWWQEFDTYRVGVTKQSESTMHTITKHKFSPDDFEFLPAEFKPEFCDRGGVVGLNEAIDTLNHVRERFLEAQDKGDKNGMRLYWFRLKALLPESYLQRRIVVLNVKALQNMYTQRKNHKLTEWRKFFDDLRRQVDAGTAYYIFGDNE